MAYRGEDVAAYGDRGRQTPWGPPADPAPGGPGAWGNEPQGYPGNEGGYPPADGGNFGYGPESSYPGYGGPGDQGYPARDDQYGSGYEQQPYGQDQYEQRQYGQHDDGYGNGQPVADGYAEQREYAPADEGYGYGPGPASGYGPQGYGQPGYEQQPPSAYQQGGGYQEPGGFGQPSPYNELPAGPGYQEPGYPDNGGYPAPSHGTSGYPAQPGGTSGYPAQPRGTSGYPALPAGTGGYPAQPGGTSGYPAQPGGTGGYPAQPGGTGGYPAEDAGNDWYGGQPAAANGASFADTGSYRLNGSVMDEYGTGPRAAMGAPARGYRPGPGTGAQSVATTRQQQRLDEGTDYRGYGQGDPAARPAQATGGYPAPESFGAPGPGYGGRAGAPPVPGGPQGDVYQDFGEGFDDPDTDGDPYQEQFGEGDEAGPDGAGGGGGGRGRARRARGGRGPLRGRSLIYAALGVAALGIIVALAYTFIFNSGGTAAEHSAQSPLPTGSAVSSQQACQQALGTYCHIESATDDPQPLTAAELYPPEFTNEKDKNSYTLVSTKLDKNCSDAVIGTDLIKELKSGKCTQVVRGSYVSGDGKIMGTIGVVNLGTTNEAHYAGKVVGKNDFIAPLTSAKGVASKMGHGTGVVEAEFKGHYLILTWSEFVDGTDPKTAAENNQLEQFSNDLVAGTANIDLSQRMVNGAPASSSAPASPSASAKTSATAKATTSAK